MVPTFLSFCFFSQGEPSQPEKGKRALLGGLEITNLLGDHPQKWFEGVPRLQKERQLWSIGRWQLDTWLWLE